MKSPYIASCYLFKSVYPAHDLSEHQLQDLGLTTAEAYALTHHRTPSLLERWWLTASLTFMKFWWFGLHKG